MGVDEYAQGPGWVWMNMLTTQGPGWGWMSMLSGLDGC